MKIRSLFLSFITAISHLSAGEATIRNLRFTLPEGYRHVPSKGIDTSVGRFLSKDGSCEIFYDIGPGAGSALEKGVPETNHHRVVRDKKITTGLGEGRFVAIRQVRDVKFSAVFDAQEGANFYAINLTEKQVDEFESIARSLLVVPDSDQQKPAQQDGADQPATAPESKSEGSDKPQPESKGRSR
jgi:hypothetical protein